MQLYRGMDIGTAKLAEPERRGVPHHLLDIWPVTQTATLGRVPDACARGDRRDPGTGQGADPGGWLGHVRPRGRRQVGHPGNRSRGPRRAGRRAGRASGRRRLHERLAELDPAAAIAILPTNGRRIVRALEVVAMRGSFSAHAAAVRTRTPTCSSSDSRVPRDGARRAHRRNGSTACGDAGFVDEVRALERAGSARGPHGVPRARLRAGARASSRGSAREEEAREETVRGHPAVRPPAGVVVRPRPPDRVAGRVGSGRGFCGGQRWAVSPPARRHRPSSRATAPRTTSSCCSTPTARHGLDLERRPGRSVRPAPRARCRRRPARRASGESAAGSWTTATPTAAPPRCAATGRGSSPWHCVTRALVTEATFADRRRVVGVRTVTVDDSAVTVVDGPGAPTVDAVP